MKNEQIKVSIKEENCRQGACLHVHCTWRYSGRKPSAALLFLGSTGPSPSDAQCSPVLQRTTKKGGTRVRQRKRSICFQVTCVLVPLRNHLFPARWRWRQQYPAVQTETRMAATAELLPLNTDGTHSKPHLPLPRSTSPWNRRAVGTAGYFFGSKSTNKSFHHCLHPSQGFPTIQRGPFEFGKSMQRLKIYITGDKELTNKTKKTQDWILSLFTLLKVATRVITANQKQT